MSTARQLRPAEQSPVDLALARIREGLDRAISQSRERAALVVSAATEYQRQVEASIAHRLIVAAGVQPEGGAPDVEEAALALLHALEALPEIGTLRARALPAALSPLSPTPLGEEAATAEPPAATAEPPVGDLPPPPSPPATEGLPPSAPASLAAPLLRERLARAPLVVVSKDPAPGWWTPFAAQFDGRVQWAHVPHSNPRRAKVLCDRLEARTVAGVVFCERGLRHAVFNPIKASALSSNALVGYAGIGTERSVLEALRLLERDLRGRR